MFLKKKKRYFAACDLCTKMCLMFLYMAIFAGLILHVNSCDRFCRFIDNGVLVCVSEKHSCML